MKVLGLVGPTASGKTALSVPIALRLDGEIISMDSRQVYRGMDVGTDKVAVEVREHVPHHGLDLIEPRERYSAGRFAREARGWIRAIHARGRVPVLVGGTGFFLKSLTEPIFAEPPLDEERRVRLRRWLRGQPLDTLERWAALLDPDRAELAAAGGRQRLSRTLELPLLTGRSMSWWHRHAPADGDPIDIDVVLLVLPREELYRRIDQRAQRMFEHGLLTEVRLLLSAGVSPEDPGMSGTGYREAAGLLRGELSLDEAVLAVQRATRAYARRQLTWYRNQLTADRILELDATRPIEEQVDAVAAWWAGSE